MIKNCPAVVTLFTARDRNGVLADHNAVIEIQTTCHCTVKLHASGPISLQSYARYPTL